MVKKRTRLDVIKDILVVLRNGHKVKITHLIYKSNLSSGSIKDYLKELVENGLVSEVKNSERVYYQITSKGNQFLEDFDKIMIFSEAYGL